MARLKVVTDQDAQAAQPKSLKEAANVSERALLVTMRTKIAAEIDNGVPPHTLAPLTRQLRDIDKEIRLLDQRRKEEAQEGAVSADEEYDASAI
jgi:hypothetical protein